MELEVKGGGTNDQAKHELLAIMSIMLAHSLGLKDVAKDGVSSPAVFIDSRAQSGGGEIEGDSMGGGLAPRSDSVSKCSRG